MKKEDKEFIESNLNSDYADFLINKKIGGWLKSKYSSYRTLIFGTIGLAVFLMGFLGFKQYELFQYVTKKKLEVDSLYHELEIQLGGINALSQKTVSINDSLRIVLENASDIFGFQLNDLRSKNDFFNELTNDNKAILRTLDRKEERYDNYVLNMNQLLQDSWKLNRELSQNIDKAESQLESLEESDIRDQIEALEQKLDYIEEYKSDLILAMNEGESNDFFFNDMKVRIEIVKITNNKLMTVKIDETEYELDSGIPSLISGVDFNITAMLIHKSGFLTSSKFTILKIRKV